MRLREGLIACLAKQENTFSFSCPIAAAALPLCLHLLAGRVVTAALGLSARCRGGTGGGGSAASNPQRRVLDPRAGILFFGGQRNVKHIYIFS